MGTNADTYITTARRFYFQEEDVGNTGAVADTIEKMP